MAAERLDPYELHDTSTLTRWEAVGRLWALGKALERCDIVGIIYATGLPLDLAATMTTQEVLDACQIRATAIARMAGVTEP